ncbi:hypothetical protein [Streptomyces yangpuensis]
MSSYGVRGVRRAIATPALGGLPQHDDHEAHLKAFGAAPYEANEAMAQEYDGLCHRLGDGGRPVVLAAGVPEDPAALWEPGGMTAAAERMADAWAGLLGATEYIDEDLIAVLEADLGLGAAAGAAAVHAALRARMDDPRTLIPLGRHYALGRAVPCRAVPCRARGCCLRPVRGRRASLSGAPVPGRHRGFRRP